MIHSKTEMVPKNIPDVHRNSKNTHKKQRNSEGTNKTKRRIKICGEKIKNWFEMKPIA
jgi:hypothetical protein